MHSPPWVTGNGAPGLTLYSFGDPNDQGPTEWTGDSKKWRAESGPHLRSFRSVSSFFLCFFFFNPNLDHSTLPTYQPLSLCSMPKASVPSQPRKHATRSVVSILGFNPHQQGPESKDLLEPTDETSEADDTLGQRPSKEGALQKRVWMCDAPGSRAGAKRAADSVDDNEPSTKKAKPAPNTTPRPPPIKPKAARAPPARKTGSSAAKPNGAQKSTSTRGRPPVKPPTSTTTPRPVPIFANNTPAKPASGKENAQAKATANTRAKSGASKARPATPVMEDAEALEEEAAQAVHNAEEDMDPALRDDLASEAEEDDNDDHVRHPHEFPIIRNEESSQVVGDLFSDAHDSNIEYASQPLSNRKGDNSEQAEYDDQDNKPSNSSLDDDAMYEDEPGYESQDNSSPQSDQDAPKTVGRAGNKGNKVPKREPTVSSFSDDADDISPNATEPWSLVCEAGARTLKETSQTKLIKDVIKRASFLATQYTLMQCAYDNLDATTRNNNMLYYAILVSAAEHVEGAEEVVVRIKEAGKAYIPNDETGIITNSSASEGRYGHLLRSLLPNKLKYVRKEAPRVCGDGIAEVYALATLSTEQRRNLLQDNCKWIFPSDEDGVPDRTLPFRHPGVVGVFEWLFTGSTKWLEGGPHAALAEPYLDILPIIKLMNGKSTIAAPIQLIAFCASIAHGKIALTLGIRTSTGKDGKKIDMFSLGYKQCIDFMEAIQTGATKSTSPAVRAAFGAQYDGVMTFFGDKIKHYRARTLTNAKHAPPKSNTPALLSQEQLAASILGLDITKLIAKD